MASAVANGSRGEAHNSMAPKWGTLPYGYGEEAGAKAGAGGAMVGHLTTTTTTPCHINYTTTLHYKTTDGAATGVRSLPLLPQLTSIYLLPLYVSVSRIYYSVCIVVVIVVVFRMRVQFGLFLGPCLLLLLLMLLLMMMLLCLCLCLCLPG